MTPTAASPTTVMVRLCSRSRDETRGRERQPRAGGLTVVAVVVDCFHERRFAPEERRLAYLLLD
jgi:hypothetical protein